MKILIIIIIALLVTLYFAYKLDPSVIYIGYLCFATFYKFIQIVLLLGVGLYKLPFHFFKRVFTQKKLDNYLIRASDLQRKQEDQQILFQKASQEYLAMLQKIPQVIFFIKKHKFHIYVDHLQKDIYLKCELSVNNENAKILDVLKIEEEEIAQKRYNFLEQQLNLHLLIIEWKEVFKKIQKYASIDQISQNNYDLSLKSLSIFQQLRLSSIGILLLILSTMIMYSGVVTIFDLESINFTRQLLEYFQNTGQVNFQMIFIGSVILYLVFVYIYKKRCYYTIFSFKSIKWYQLVKNNTNQIMMLRNQSLIMWLDVKIQIKLGICYTCMLLMDQIYITPPFKSSSFRDFYQPIKKFPFLGQNFNILIPSLILCISLVYNLWAMNHYGKGDFSESFIEKRHDGKNWFLTEYLAKKNQNSINQSSIIKKDESQFQQSPTERRNVNSHYFEINHSLENYRPLIKTSNLQNSEDIFSAYFLLKQGLFWNKRWMVLKEPHLYIYLDEKEESKLNTFKLEDVKGITKVKDIWELKMQGQTWQIENKSEGMGESFIERLEYLIMMQKINDI